MILALALPLLLLQDAPPAELRGAWITVDDQAALDTRAELAAAMQTLAECGLNAVFPPCREADREFLAAIVFEAHRHGLEVLPWFESGGDEVVRKATEACRDHDLDGVLGSEAVEDLRKEVAAVDPELTVLAPADLPKVSSAAPKKAGPVLLGLAKLLEKDAELARSLREGLFAEDARLPWRKDRMRRPPASPIEPFAGGGVWTWMTPKTDPRFLAMDGGEEGHTTWNFEPAETGNYSLYAWIPSREDLAARSNYKIASAGGMRTIGIETGSAKVRGWVYLGEARLTAGKPIEVARLEAREEDATLITAAGPLLVLRSHRPKPR